MKCQNDGKYFHGSLERAASHQRCLVKISTGAQTPLERRPWHWNQITFGISLPLSFLRNANVKSICPDHVLLGAERNHCPLFIWKWTLFVYSLFQSLTLGLKLHFICSWCSSSHMHALCPSSFFKRYFTFLKAGTSVNSDLPFPVSPQWEFLHFELPSTLPETDYFVPQKQTISFPRCWSLETGIGYIQNTAETD